MMAFDIDAGSSPLFLREYLSSAFKVLTNSPNIPNVTKSNFFQLSLSQINRHSSMNPLPR